MKRAKYFTPVVGQTYTNRNGDQYLCKGGKNSLVVMERVSDGWTLVAHGVQQYDDGTIEWDYSTGGHWIYSGEIRQMVRLTPEIQNVVNEIDSLFMLHEVVHFWWEQNKQAILPESMEITLGLMYQHFLENRRLF